MLDDFRSLNWLVTSPRYGLYTEWPWDEFPQDRPERFRRVYEADYDMWKAVRGLAYSCLGCGWNVNAMDQSKLRRDDFIERRKRYLEMVVAPLKEIHRRAYEERRARDAAKNELRKSQHGHSNNPRYRLFEP